MGEIVEGINGLFEAVLNLSMVGSYVIIFVLLVRALLCKAPKWCSYLLWAVVFLRLVCPVFPEGHFSLIPGALEIDFGENNVVQQAAFEGQYDEWVSATGQQSGITESNIAESYVTEFHISESNIAGQWTNVAGEESDLNSVGSTTDRQQDFVEMEAAADAQADASGLQAGIGGQMANSAEMQADANGQYINLAEQHISSDEQASNSGALQSGANYSIFFACIWLAGAICLAGYHTFSYWRLKNRVKGAAMTEPGVCEVQGEHLSFVMGILRPTIYLSAGLDEESRQVVLCHEQVHLRRKDYLTKPIALAICCVHWFNPLVWLAFYCMSKDCEVSCDERVVSLLGENSKKVYSYALLDEATRGERRTYKRENVCALLSFGEDNVKHRISHVLKYRKASVWMVAAAVIVLVAVVAGLCSNPGATIVTEEQAISQVLAAGDYAEDSQAVCYLKDYNNDNKSEAFVEIPAKEESTHRDLWYVSRKGEATLVLADKELAGEQDFYSVFNGCFLLISYMEDNIEENKQVTSHVYGVDDDDKVIKVLEGRNAEIIDGDIVCVYEDNMLEYDINNKTFSGQNEKSYCFYYDGESFLEYAGHELSREDVESYVNGSEMLAEVEALYPEGYYQYIARNNGVLHINVAYEDPNPLENILHFWNVTYEVKDNELIKQGSGDGCYRHNITGAGEVSFAEEIAKKYGWQTDNDIVQFQVTAEAALECFASAYAARNGDTLYQLSYDKENFENWNKVIPLAQGGYAFGDSSPWVSSYEIDYPAGQDTATIRLFLTNSVPEMYIAEETVKVVKDGALYYVDHADYKSYTDIATREELAEIYNLNDKNAFGFAATGYSQSHTRYIFNHILKETNPEYYNVYTDPVTAAKAYLHLGEGSGEVTEIRFATKPYVLHHSSYGEGTIVTVTYTFAEDGSTVDIPMVLAEESKNVWALSAADYYMVEQGKTEENQKMIFSDNARRVYASRTVDDNPYPVYQASNYGLYRYDGNELTCIYPTYMLSDVKLAFYEGKVYFTTDSRYEEGALDWEYDSICEVNPNTGEADLIPLSEDAMRTFPLSYFQVKDGYIRMYAKNSLGSGYAFLLRDTEPVWEGKTAVKLTEEERTAYGVNLREYLLANPGTVVSVGNRTEEMTFALIDMDGDGITEEISITPVEDDSYNSTPMDSFKLQCGEGSEKCTAENMYNDIFAFSPDGERIYIALYEDGHSGDPLTRLYKYEYNRLQSAGGFQNDIRKVIIENGIISTIIRRDVIQTDYIHVQFGMDENGDWYMLPQDTYKFIEKADGGWIILTEELLLHEEIMSTETEVLEPQQARVLEVDSSRKWLLIEGENGQQGWIQLSQFHGAKGLNMAG